ncbi:MAG: glycosyltransferase family 4 protein [Bacteroidetes bacterium]|nr:glycosyltransferase family 4 protein [Bacteroidota bacterium]
MKIALDCRMKHGVETVVKNIAPLIAAEEELRVLGDTRRFNEWWSGGIPAKYIPFDAPIYGLREQFEFPLDKIRDCDLLHVPHFNIPVRRLPMPLVVTINDVGHLAGVLPIGWGYKQAAKFYYSYAAKKASHIITISEFSKQEIISRLNVPPEKVTVIHCGVDTKMFHRVSEEKTNRVLSRLHLQSPYLMISGSVRPHKNIGRVLQAFIELKKRHRIPHKLAIVGEREGFRINSELPSLDDDIAEDVVFTGFISDDDLIALYSGCEVFIFASIYEGFGLPPLEAMACGAPVAVSHAASLPEVVGDAGLYFDPFSVEEIVNAVNSLITDQTTRERLSVASLARAREFGWAARAEEYLEIYRQVVNRAG